MQGLNSLEHEFAQPFRKAFQAPCEARLSAWARRGREWVRSWRAADTSKLPASLKKALHRKLRCGRSRAEITNGAYDPTDIYSYESYAYDWPGSFGLYNAGPLLQPAGQFQCQTPTETSIAIAAFADAESRATLPASSTQYPYLAYNIQHL